MGRPCCIQLAGASCEASSEASAYTSEHRQLQLHGPTRFIEICIKGSGIRISSHCWFLPHPSAALKNTLKKTPTIRKHICTNMQRLNLATSTIVHLLRKLPPPVPQLQRAHLLWLRPAFSFVPIGFDLKSDSVKGEEFRAAVAPECKHCSGKRRQPKLQNSIKTTGHNPSWKR